MKKLLILGAGQYGIVAKEIAESTQEYDAIDYLDDCSKIAIGKIADYEKFTDTYDSAVVAIGNAEMRLKYIEKLSKAGFNVPSLIHAKACVSPSAVIGIGSFIEPLAVVHTDVTVGIGCIISAGTILNHNSRIGDGCHLNCGTIVKARAAVDRMFKSDYGQIVSDWIVTSQKVSGG